MQKHQDEALDLHRDEPEEKQSLSNYFRLITHLVTKISHKIPRYYCYCHINHWNASSSMRHTCFRDVLAAHSTHGWPEQTDTDLKH